MSGGEGGEYRVEDIKLEIERLERRQAAQRVDSGGLYEGRHQYSSGGRISTNGSLTLGIYILSINYYY